MQKYPVLPQNEEMVVDMQLNPLSRLQVIETVYQYAESENFRYLQSLIIIDKYHLLVNHLSKLSDIDSHLLRFAVFFIILLRNTGHCTDLSLEEKLIWKYIEEISATADINTIGYLCQYLTSEMQPKAYANYMTIRYEATQDIARGMQMCEQFGLDCVKVAYEATSILFLRCDLFVCFPTSLPRTHFLERNVHK